MNMRKLTCGGICTLILCCIIICFVYYYNKWKHIWERFPQMPIYTTYQQVDDTLRVGMIGDSWAFLHHVTLMDTFLSRHLSDELNRPVKVLSKGKNGEISRGIYKNMFSYGKDGTKYIIEEGLDYCIISAGINDAVRNLGIKQYIYHYQLIVDFMMSNSICPIVIEIPNVDIWNSQQNKPIKEIAVDYIRSMMTGSPMYNCAEYRDELKKVLINDFENIIYISLIEWNGTELGIRNELSLPDQIHLNFNGYKNLDSAIIRAIKEKEQK